MLELGDRALWWARNHVVPTIGGAVVLAAVVVGAIVLIGGSSSSPGKIPDGAVAVVGDTPIERSAFTHWQGVYRKAAANSSATVTPAQVNRAVVELLVGTAWIESEARRQHTTVSTSQVSAAVTRLYAQAKTQGASKSAVLAQLGGSEADLRAEQRSSLLASALQAKAAKTARPVTAAQVQSAYAAEPARWARPTQRDVRAIVATDQANAKAALSALNAGQSFSATSTKYTTNSQLSSSKGVLKALRPGTNDPLFERAIFTAPVGQLVGPVRIASGWAVVKVQRSTALPAKTLKASSAAIRAELANEAQGRVVDAFVKQMRTYWHARTRCTAGVRVTTYCA